MNSCIHRGKKKGDSGSFVPNKIVKNMFFSNTRTVTECTEKNPLMEYANKNDSKCPRLG